MSWTTVQLDFHLPEQFDLTYIGEDGNKHRPVMIHRSIIGSLERIVAHLIERWNGAFPVWVAPSQVVVLPVEPIHLDAASRVSSALVEAGVRCRVDDSDESLGERVRRARLQKVPFVAVVGKREVESGSVSVRGRDGERHNGIPLAAFADGVARLNRQRSLGLHLGPAK